MTPDPALETVREARRRISRELDHDAARLIERYRRTCGASITGVMYSHVSCEVSTHDARADLCAGGSAAEARPRSRFGHRMARGRKADDGAPS